MTHAFNFWPVATAAAVLLTSACSTTVSDNLDVSQLEARKTGVAIMMMEMVDVACPTQNVMIGQKAGNGYRSVKLVIRRQMNIHALMGTPVPPAQIELPPGEYHIVSVFCQTSNAYFVIGSRQPFDVGNGAHYSQSFATFSLEPGEVVNVGNLKADVHHRDPNIITGELTVPRFVFKAVDLPPGPRADLERVNPALLRSMKTRLMTIIPHEPQALQSSMF